jgi:hypothetical protein
MNVRYRSESGKYLLVLSLSVFDPTSTLAAPNSKCSRCLFQPLSKYSLKPLSYRPLSLGGADMKRRTFIATVGCASAWPVVARAQVPVLPVIGVLGSADNDDDGHAHVKAFPSEAD